MPTNEELMLIKPPNEKPETKKMGSMHLNGFKLTNEYQEI